MKNYGISLTLFSVLAVAAFPLGIAAQDTKPEPCPDVTVMGPPAEPKQDQVAEYSVIVDSKGIYRQITLEWSAFGGKVLEGQGTNSVKVQRIGADFFVNVRVRGLRPKCEQIYREEKPDLTPPEAIMLDRIVGPLTPSDDEKLKLFIDATKAERKSVFWVILAYKKNDGASGVSHRRRLLLDSFEKIGRIGHDARVTFVEVEADEDFIEFWRTTANARPQILDK